MAVDVTVPAVVLGGIVIVTGPLPWPLAGVTLKPLAIQAEPALLLGQEEITLTVAWPPAAPVLIVEGFNAKEHPGPNCVMV